MQVNHKTRLPLLAAFSYSNYEHDITAATFHDLFQQQMAHVSLLCEASKKGGAGRD